MVDVLNALVAQLDRVFDYESKGRGFEPLRARQVKTSEIAFSWAFQRFLLFMKGIRAYQHHNVFFGVAIDYL